MSKIIVVNNFVDIPDEKNLCEHNADSALMFLGKMNYEPNVTAVTYFAEKIYPKLKIKFKDLTFKIVGIHPIKTVLELGKIEGIEVTGFVPDPSIYFRTSSIVVAPMLTGAGVQNKILQAMSYSCCVATSPIGAEGLKLNGDELMILNTDSEWIDGLTMLLENREMRKEFGMNARRTIMDTLSKEVVYNQFKTLFS